MNCHLSTAVASEGRRLLEVFTAISSPSGDAAGITRYGEAVAGEFRRRGLAASLAPASPFGSALPLLTVAGARTEGSCLLLLSHLDTVLPARPPSWSGQRLEATGSIDTKSGLAALLCALDTLAERGDEAPRDLLLVAVPDEEVAGHVSHAATREYGAQARAVWVLEPGEPRGDAETIVAGRRGMFPWRARFQGKSAHSGLHFWQGRSALDAAARMAVGARGLSIEGRGRTVNPARLVAGDGNFVEELAANAAILGSERQVNVIPDRAVLEGEARFLRPAEGTATAGELRQLGQRIAAEVGVACDLWIGETVPPVDPAGSQRALGQRAVEFADRRGWSLEIEEDRGGISFPNFLADPGRVPVLDGLAPVGGGMHTREEFMHWTSFERRVLLLADLLAEDRKEFAA
jgi:glutamate carboxypeptidase